MRIHSVVVATLILLSVTNLWAQFGKNKVQYQSFQWWYITSPHFDIYYHDSLDYIARFCAYKAEDALASLVGSFGFRPNKRMTIVLYGSHNQFQQTNIIGQLLPEGIGGVTELFKNRMVLPFEGDWEKFRHVIHHELVHAYLNEMFYAGSIQVALYSRSTIPIWMNEGLAEYESLGGLDVQTDMFMRDLALSEALRPLDQLDGYLAYRCGQAFYAYIERQYGKGKVAELIHKLRHAQTPSAAFEATFGKSLEDFSEEWQNAMRKMYWPDLDRFSRLDDFAQRLTNHTKDGNYYYSSPAISPDGRRAALISDRDGDFAIYIMDLSSRNMRRLISSGRTLDFEELNILTPGISWSPDGTKLAVTAKAGGQDALYIVDVESGDYEKYTFGLPTMTSAAWSPDGRFIAVTAVRAEQPDIYLFDLQTKTIVQLTDDLFTEQNPVWGPDSVTLYFISDRGDDLSPSHATKTTFQTWRHRLGQSDIYRIHIASRTIERITHTPDDQKSSIAVSTTGQRLLYVSTANGIGNLYELDLATGKSKPKTNSLSGLMQLSLARDDSKLLFAAQNKIGYDLFMIRNPFEVEFKLDTLPLTKLVQQQRQRSQMVETIRRSSDSLDGSRTLAFVGYGKFDVEIAPPRLTSSDTAIAGNPTVAAYESASRGYDFTPHPYKVTITNDIVMSTGGFNTLWGTFQGSLQMLFSDVMGDHQIYAAVNLWQDLKNTFIYAQYAYLPSIVDYLVTVQQYSVLWLLPYGPTYTYNLLRTYGAGVEAVYAWSTFERVELGLRWVGIARENLDIPTDPGYTANYMVPSFAYVLDNTDFGFLAPYRGTRMRLSAEASPWTKPFTIFRADVRYYLPVMSYLYGFAFRAAGGISLGGSPRRFYIGGLDNWFNRAVAVDATIFEEPEDLAFLQLEMPLRGFDLAQEGGTRYFLLNAEWRFPIFYALAGGPLPISVGGIMGALFLDVGTAWNGTETLALRQPETVYDTAGNTYNVYSPGTILMGTGIGLRTVLLGYPFKIDIAWRYDGQNWSPPWWLFSLGLDI
ncbi:MAG: BamA/TamA family outer membrane protein [Chlorobi bacterium]|jgi:Tol biopolymer transport system component|nr:BamA/TamA family outer membrane protein [Chlorobiota bacterium]